MVSFLFSPNGRMFQNDGFSLLPPTAGGNETAILKEISASYQMT